MRLYTKVLVVGGGPAGATAARVLAAHGADVILLEKNLSFSKPCGGGITLSAFDEFSIPRKAIKRVAKKIRLISPQGEEVVIGLGDGGLAIVRRGEFDFLLREKAEERGARIIEGEFSEIAAGRPCRIMSRVKGDAIEIIAEYVIAADGVNSPVRRALKIGPPQRLFAVSEHIRERGEDTCEFWFGCSHAPGLYSWIFPAEGGISVGTGSFQPWKLRGLFEKFKIRAGIKTETPGRIYGIPIWKGDLYSKDNVLFAGDSAGHVLPLTYEGIYYAMKSAETAAQAILEGKAHKYKKMWQTGFQKKFVLMGRLRSFFLKDDAHVEKLVALHKRPEIQQASLRLWLTKDTSKEGLLSYLGFFRKFLS
ncbi:MAG: NAD(P)/FAD-dependent oxidoreductase [Nitrospirota bacterium]